MAKSNNSTFGDFSEKIKLTPDRMNLKQVNQKLTFEQHLSQAIQEGYALLEEDAKNPKNSVKAPGSVKPSPALEDALAKMSDNPYIAARVEILKKMSPIARSVIEKMEKGELPKDLRWETFCKAVTIKGDQISSGNNNNNNNNTKQL